MKALNLTRPNCESIIVFVKLLQRIKNLKTNRINKDVETPPIVVIEEPKALQSAKVKTSTVIDKAQASVSKESKKTKAAVVEVKFNSNQKELFDRLKSLRAELATKNNKPAHYIFTNATLKDMVFKDPKNKADMLEVYGVAEKKFGLYGKEFLNLLTNKAGALTPNEQVLFELLKSLRLNFAHKNKMPAYTVFKDKTLRDMVVQMPKNKAEMMTINGVGEVSFAKYGKDFLKVIEGRSSGPKIESKPPRAIEDIEHHDYLIENIGSSEIRLIIISGWITQHVVDSAFLRLIGEKLEQGVKIYIGYGYQDYKGNHDEFGGSQAALTSLQELMQQYPDQLFVACFATHEKLFLVDSKSVAIGSANWLAKRNYDINSERSVIIEGDKAFIQQEAARAIESIQQSLVS